MCWLWICYMGNVCLITWFSHCQYIYFNKCFSIFIILCKFCSIIWFSHCQISLSQGRMVFLLLSCIWRQNTIYCLQLCNAGSIAYSTLLQVLSGIVLWGKGYYCTFVNRANGTPMLICQYIDTFSLCVSRINLRGGI